MAATLHIKKNSYVINLIIQGKTQITSKQINERKGTSQIDIMKSVLIMKNNNNIYKNNTKKQQRTLFGKKFFVKVHGLYFKFIAQRNISILIYMLVIIAYVALFRRIQEYMALDANNITLVFDSGNI